MRKLSFILVLSVLLMPACLSAPVDVGGHAGTPAGFYDDIDPNSLDNDYEDNLPQGQYQQPSEKEEYNNPAQDYSWEQDIHELSDEEGMILAPPQANSTKNYSWIYNNLEPADFSYLHNIDPDQYYDMKDTAWSVYPLLRLNSEIYFKGQTIVPGYYLLTPREHKGKWYILFKQNGLVVHIIPVYDRDYTPEKFYDEHIPQPKLTKSQKIHMGVLSFIGEHFESSKRKDPVKSFLEVNDLENHFVSIIIYYGGHKYSTIFRTIKL